jgi:hypothetical protein
MLSSLGKNDRWALELTGIEPGLGGFVQVLATPQ